MSEQITRYGLIGDDYVFKAIWYSEISSGTTGTITPPAGGTFLLDEFASGVDALCVGMSGVGGFPTWQTVVEADATPVVVSSFNELGNYILSGTPASYPVAVVFVYSVLVRNYDVNFDFLEHEIPGSGGGTSNHAALSNLAWSGAGHTIDADIEMGSNVLNASGGKVRVKDDGTTSPSSQNDGYLGVAYISSEGRIYFWVEGVRYYVTGSAAPDIQTGNPIGLLLALTYTV